MLKLERFASVIVVSIVDIVAEAARDEEARARVDHRIAGELVGLEHLVLGEPVRGREHRRGRGVEHLEIARIEHDAGGIAFAPLDAAQVMR